MQVLMWGNIVQPVEKATVCVTSVKFETALMRCQKIKKNHKAEQEKLELTLNIIVLFVLVITSQVLVLY